MEYVLLSKQSSVVHRGLCYSTAEETARPIYTLHKAYNPHTPMKPGDVSKMSPVERIRCVMYIIHIYPPIIPGGVPRMPPDDHKP